MKNSWHKLSKWRFSKLNFIRLLKTLLIMGTWISTILIGYILYVTHDLPNIDKLEEPRKGRKIIILDNNGQAVSTYGNIYGYYIPYSEIPKNLINAIISIEDRKFFDHPGVDVIGILRAAIANFKAGYVVQGGSTITQQLAKITLLHPKKTIKRKIQEALLSLELENKYTKEQILSIYLNKVYLGAGMYGIDAAAKYYFGKNVQELSLYECAIIAGLPKAPSRFSPISNPELSGQRAYQVLLSMFKNGYITRDELDDTEKYVKLNTSLLGSRKFGYFSSWINENIGQYIEVGDVDITVRTTLDRHIQNVAQRILNKYINKYGEEKKISQGAVVVMTPYGKILALVGGTNFLKSPFNRAIQAFRPAGSIFKIFVYTSALEHGYSIDTILEDKPITFGSWSPTNYYSDKYYGEITMEEAFAKSINTVAVQVTHEVGVGNVIDLAHRMGINSNIEHNLSIALGSVSVNLLEITSSYAAIANDGLFSEPYSVESIKNSNTGTLLYLKPRQQELQAVTREVAQDMQVLLRSCVTQGSGRNAFLEDLKISGKTGTSQDYRDAWFIGFSDKYVVGVWLGNDNYSPMKRVGGWRYPPMIVRDILKTLE
ncbi:MAG: PBP1A family penicillin-binding protein [Rickettsiales bacterium]|nr:PBP1A family penicillin-binding protein [Rickettsiales bacterium]